MKRTAWDSTQIIVVRNYNLTVTIIHTRRNTFCSALTHDRQVNQVGHVRRGGHLALVRPRVAVLRVLELQHPVVAAVVLRAEALVVGVRVQAHGEQVGVAVPHPGHLQSVHIV